MPFFRALAACALLAVSFAACKSDDDTQPVAGKGGPTSVRVTPRHHNIPIDSCIVYIKYNAQDKPAGDVYDDSARAQGAGNGVPAQAAFPNLRPGNYYIFGRGYDPAGSYVVRGGTPFTIPDNKVTYDVNLPVGEE
jgi:hypothetical protein